MHAHTQKGCLSGHYLHLRFVMRKGRATFPESQSLEEEDLKWTSNTLGKRDNPLHFLVCASQPEECHQPLSSALGKLYRWKRNLPGRAIRAPPSLTASKPGVAAKGGFVTLKCRNLSGGQCGWGWWRTTWFLKTKLRDPALPCCWPQPGSLLVSFSRRGWVMSQVGSVELRVDS